MFKSLIASLAVAVLMWGCAAPTTFKDASWTEHPQSVKVVYTEPVIGNPDFLAKDLPDYKDHFSDWFDSIVVAKMDNESSRKIHSTMKKVAESDITTQKVKLGEADFDAPAYGSMDDADVYLVLSNLWIGLGETTATVPGSQASQAAPGGGRFVYTDFTAVCKYAFYDAKTGKLLAYGQQKGKTPYHFSNDDWEVAVQNLIGSLVAFTPILPW